VKRDMDFVRDLLLRIESGEINFEGAPKAFTGQPLNPEAEKLGEHLRLLKQAGFVDVQAESLTGLIVVSGLSWRGHDFLDSVRDPKIWAKTKSAVESAGGFTVELMKDLAKGFVKKQIEDRTGVKL
jgi:hypothetical protein